MRFGLNACARRRELWLFADPLGYDRYRSCLCESASVSCLACIRASSSWARMMPTGQDEAFSLLLDPAAARRIKGSARLQVCRSAGAGDLRSMAFDPSE